MSIDTARATAAPMEIELGGEKYLLSPFRDKDFGEFTRWVKGRIVQLAKDSLDGLPDNERKFLLVHAFEKANLIEINSPDAIRAMATLDGAAKLLYLGLRRNHPELTEQKVLEILTEPQSLAKAMDNVDTLMELDRVSGTKSEKKAPSIEAPSIDFSQKNTDGPPTK